MTNEEFWDFFCIGDPTEKYDEICKFFSKKLDKDFLENYDYLTIIYSLLYELFQNNDFEKALEFIKFIEKKQPGIYQENYEILDKYLLNYYFYIEDKKQLDNVFSNYLKYRIINQLVYIDKIEKFICYQYYDIIDKQFFEKFTKFPDIKEFSSELITIIFHYQLLLTLETAFYEKGKTKENFIIEIKELFPTDINDNTSYYPLRIAKELIKDKLYKEELQKQFKEEKVLFLFQVKIKFFKYMYEKNIKFNLSELMWEHTLNIFNFKKEYSSPDEFFKVAPKRFQKYLNKYSVYSNEDIEQYYLVIWGSVYVYDFLKSMDIISDETYNHFIYMTKYLKGVAIYKQIKYLWNFNFIHSWERPDSISEAEFNAEKNIFNKTFDNYIYNFHYNKDLFEEDLENIGELSKYILDCDKKYIEQKREKREKNKSIQNS